MPEDLRAFTTRHVLTMEYIDGFSPDDLEALDRAGYDRAEIAGKLADNYIKQIVDDGFFMPTRTRAICASAAGRSSGSTWA